MPDNTAVIKKIFILAAAVFISSGCSTSRNTTMQIADFDKQGHRGARGIMPENSLPAMLTAIDLGVTTLEMDVVITADSQLILSHEPFFNHEITTLPDGKFVDEKNEKDLNIYKMSYSQTQQYEVGMKPHPRFPKQKKVRVTKPLLADVLTTADAYTKEKKLKPVYFNIETKTKPETDDKFHPAPEKFVDLLMRVIIKSGTRERVIIQSFDPRTLQVVHAKYPDVKTALLIEDYDKRGLARQLADLGFTPTIYSPAYKLVTAALIKNCHVKKIKIIPWTVNDSSLIKKFRDMGADGIISDYPDLF